MKPLQNPFMYYQILLETLREYFWGRGMISPVHCLSNMCQMHRRLIKKEMGPRTWLAWSSMFLYISRSYSLHQKSTERGTSIISLVPLLASAWGMFVYLFRSWTKGWRYGSVLAAPVWGPEFWSSTVPQKTDSWHMAIAPALGWRRWVDPNLKFLF